MIYDIRLKISYEYQYPVSGGRHILRLMPADLPGVQRRLSGTLTIDPEPSERREMQDFFRNSCVEVGFRRPHADIAFQIQARVECLAESPSLDMSPDLRNLAHEISGHRGLDPFSPHHFTGPSPLIRRSAEMAAYARALISPEQTVFGIVITLGEALNRDLKYDPDATQVDTPVEEAFERRHGVCQDFAHIMIGCLRGVGIPAGYVSGFLRTIPPPGQARMEGADAMHAWVRVWCGLETGWIEYDPTNAIIVGTDHIVVSRGRDYGDVTPVWGILRMSGDQKSDQSVDVLPVTTVDA